VGRPPGIPFQLAPRLYVLALAPGGSRRRKASHRAAFALPTGELPRHLNFHESPLDVGARTRQTWISEAGGQWNWVLVVERHDGVVKATLTAAPPAEFPQTGPLVWNHRGEWNAFGRNRLVAEPGAVECPPLVVFSP
jgi:hypothetical protein